MLHVVWGDDEHTSIDGPYARLMKARKWIYILSLTGLVIEFGLYNEAATEALIRVVDAPASLIRGLVVLGLVYLMAQYAMLAVQLGTAYQAVLNMRFEHQRQNDVQAATDQVKQARRALTAAKGLPVSHTNRQSKIDEAEADLDDARASRQQLLALNHARHPVYRRLEVGIDCLRVMAPFVAGSWALFVTLR